MEGVGFHAAGEDDAQASGLAKGAGPDLRVRATTAAGAVVSQNAARPTGQDVGEDCHTSSFFSISAMKPRITIGSANMPMPKIAMNEAMSCPTPVTG